MGPGVQLLVSSGQHIWYWLTALHFLGLAALVAVPRVREGESSEAGSPCPRAQSWRQWRDDLSFHVSLAVWVGLAPLLKAVQAGVKVTGR